jgi:hypothetical protein
MRESKLFCALPDYISTPDSMAIDRYGNLVLSCPNFAESDSSGCVVKISREGKVTKWFDVPVHPDPGKRRPGIRSRIADFYLGTPRSRLVHPLWYHAGGGVFL